VITSPIFGSGTRYVILCASRPNTRPPVNFLVSSLRSLTRHRHHPQLHLLQLHNNKPSLARFSINVYCKVVSGSWPQQRRNRTSIIRTSRLLPRKADSTNNHAVPVPSRRQNALPSRNSSKKSTTHHGRPLLPSLIF